jgi:AcrR family transcriptional regulator
MADASPSRPARRRLPRDQRVAIIMQGAREVLRERGYEQFLTSEVAERCGISEGTIYKYFATKRDLLIQVAEVWFEEFLTTEKPPSVERPIRERLFHVIWNNLSLVRRQPTLSRFVLMELRPDPNFRSMRIYQINKRIAEKVMEVVRDGVARGDLRGDIPLKLIRDMIFGAIEHQTWAYLRGEGDFSVEDSAEGITDVVFRGIAVHPAATPSDWEGALARIERVATKLETISRRQPELISGPRVKRPGEIA